MMDEGKETAEFHDFWVERNGEGVSGSYAYYFGKLTWLEATRRADKQAQDSLLTLAIGRWDAEVKHRPLENRHRRSLDDAWRQVIRYAGATPEDVIGPCHDELLAIRATIPQEE